MKKLSLQILLTCIHRLSKCKLPKIFCQLPKKYLILKKVQSHTVKQSSRLANGKTKDIVDIGKISKQLFQDQGAIL